MTVDEEKINNFKHRIGTCKIYYKTKEGKWISAKLIGERFLYCENDVVIDFDYGDVVFDWIQRKTIDKEDITKINESEYFMNTKEESRKK